MDHTAPSPKNTTYADILRSALELDKYLWKYLWTYIPKLADRSMLNMIKTSSLS